MCSRSSLKVCWEGLNDGFGNWALGLGCLQLKAMPSSMGRVMGKKYAEMEYQKASNAHPKL